MVYENLRLHKWYGRLGNNLRQLLNVIWIAKKNRSNIIYMLPHEFLNVDNIPAKYLSNNGLSDKIKRNTISANFFSMTGLAALIHNKSHSSNDNTSPRKVIIPYQDQQDIFSGAIFPTLPVELQSLEPFSDDTLVVHMRSGDVFRENCKNIHPMYTPLPLSYYCKVIMDTIPTYKYTSVIIVTEQDMVYPGIKGLQTWLCESYPNVKVQVQTGTLLEDIRTILRAVHFVLGIGYFSETLSLLSKHARHIYKSSGQPNVTSLRTTQHHAKQPPHQLDLSKDMYKSIYVYDVHNYIPLGEWTDSDVQRAQILQHDIKDVNKVDTIKIKCANV